MNTLQRLAKEAGLRVDVSAQAREQSSADFGGLARGQALGVVAPADTDELVRVIDFAVKRGVPLTVRGTGFGQSGQSVAHDSLSVSLRHFTKTELIEGDNTSAWCGAGATWRMVTAMTLKRGLVPTVLPLNLDLSVGGVLSAGGVGSSSHRYGALVDNVLQVEVVTGSGEFVRCSPTQQAELFHAILGGLGRFGFITRAQVALRRVAPRMRTFYLHYRNLNRFVEDQRILVESKRGDHLEGFCSAAVQGLRKAPSGRRVPFALWSYGLHVTVEYDEDPPITEDVTGTLQFDELVHMEDDDVFAFASRYDVRFEAMRAIGAWKQLHPWFECLIPMSAAARLLPDVLDKIPLVLGDGHRATWVKEGPQTTSFMRTEQQPALAFAVLPMGVAEPMRESVLSALVEIERVLVGAGGKRYLSGWLFDRSKDAWKRHYGAMYDAWMQCKARYDPHHLLRSSLFPD